MQVDYVLREDENNAGEQKDSFIRRIIESNANGRKLTTLADAEFDREKLTMVVRDFAMAGGDTTATTLLWAIISLANSPDAQLRLQKEVDDVVERVRQPLLDDEPKMPYAQAVILETLRLYTPVPLSLFRSTTCDTAIGDYFIPVNTLVRICHQT